MTRAERKAIRNAVADFIFASGCGCCRDNDLYALTEERLGMMLRVPRYNDLSGRDWAKFRTNTRRKRT